MTELRVLPSPAPEAAPVVPVVPQQARVVIPITEVHARGGRFCCCRTCSMARHPSYAGRAGRAG